MSLIRLVYYTAVVGGWAAFLGWLVAECLILRGDGGRGGFLGLLMVGALIGAAIGAGLSLVAEFGNARLSKMIMRAPVGLLGGGIGGAVGILVGQLVYYIGLPRALGFMVLGLGVGVIEGLYERSKSKIRNGVIGGVIGGLVGGFLFDPINSLLASDSGIASRATAFVILGMCIGALIGLVQVVLKEAWLTVMDGYGVGRQFILSRPVTVLGRADHLQLPFLGPSNQNLDSEHLRIVRQDNGSFAVEDNSSKLGVSLRPAGEDRYQDVRGSRPLGNGDVIRFGSNLVRFNERKGKREDGTTEPMPKPDPTDARPKAPTPPAPPPPPPGRGRQKAGGATSSSQTTPAPTQPAKPEQASATKPASQEPEVGKTASKPQPKRPNGGSALPPPPPPPPGKKK